MTGVMMLLTLGSKSTFSSGNEVPQVTYEVERRDSFEEGPGLDFGKSPKVDKIAANLGHLTRNLPVVPQYSLRGLR